MVKLHYYQILFLLGIFLTVPSHAANYYGYDEGKNDDQDTYVHPKLFVDYYDHTLKNSKKKIDNIVDPEDIEEEQEHFKDNHIVEKLENTKGAVFFMVIVSDEKTKKLSKFFFMNRKPNVEKVAVGKVERLFRCHVISNSNPKSSSHIVFQMLGWLEQEERKYIPVFIYSNCPLCVTCHAIVLHLFHLDMPKSSKGCSGASSIDLEKVCPLAKKHINSCLTLALAKKIFLPSLHLEYESRLELLKNSKEKAEQNSLLKGQEVAKLLLEKGALQKKCNSLEKEKEELKEKNGALQNKNYDLQEEHDDFKMMLYRRKKKCNSLEEENGALQNKCNNLKKAKDDLKKELEDKIKENVTLKKERDILNEKLAKINKFVAPNELSPFYDNIATKIRRIIDEKK